MIAQAPSVLSPLDQTVSTFLGTGIAVKSHIALKTILQCIQSDTYKTSIEQLRAIDRANNEAAYKAAKEQLNSFTPCCDLKTRAQKAAWPEKLLSCSGLVHFDYDHLQDPEALKAQLAADSHCVFAFVSPGGAGVKVGFAAQGIVDVDSYKRVWHAFGAYLKVTYPEQTFSEDKNVKYLNALCFMSYDPQLFLRDDPEVFNVPPSSSSPSSSSSSSSSSRASSSFLPPSSPDYDRVASALDSIADIDTYDTWLRVGMALHSSGESWARGLWDAWSRRSAKYDPETQHTTWESFQPDGKTQLGTVFHLAKEAGWQDSQVSHKRPAPIPMMGQAAPTDHADADRSEKPPVDPEAAAQQLYESLNNTAEDQRSPESLFHQIAALAGLSAASWSIWKIRFKKLFGRSLSLRDLEKAREEARQNLKDQHATEAPIAEEESEAAAYLAEQFAGKLAYDITLERWRVYGIRRKGVWDTVKDTQVQGMVQEALPAILADGFTANFAKGVMTLLRGHLYRTFSKAAREAVPFTNGVLNTQTMELLSHDPSHACIWSLPYAYQAVPPETDCAHHCPETLRFLRKATGDKDDQVVLLRAYMRAVVLGLIHYHKFLELIGPGGSGKGTFLRLVLSLVGEENSGATELSRLEGGRFDTHHLIDKKLIIITDQKRYAGDVDRLKAITGGDSIPIEQKFKDPGEAPAAGLVIVAANSAIESADYTSGLLRRRITIHFKHVPTARERRELLTLHAGGAPTGDLAAELPAVLTWVLAMDEALMDKALSNTATHIPSLRDAWMENLLATNPMARWASKMLVHDPIAIPVAGQGVKIGYARRADRSTSYEYEETWLYPSYRRLTDDSGEKGHSLQHFTDLLLDLLQNQLKLSGLHHTRDKHGSMLHGVRFRSTKAGDDDMPTLEVAAAAQMKDDEGAMRSEPRTDEGDEGDEDLQKSSLYKIYNAYFAPYPPRSPNGVLHKTPIGGSESQKSSSPSSPSSAHASDLPSALSPSLSPGIGIPFLTNGATPGVRGASLPTESEPANAVEYEEHT